MADTGWLNPTSVTNDTSVGTLAWSNPSNAASEDGSSATAATAGTEYTNYLRAAYSPNIGAGANIDGFEFRFKRSNPQFQFVWAESIRLYIGGSYVGNNKGVSGLSWNESSLTFETTGGATDKWGLTPSVADVNAIAVGIQAYVGNYDGAFAQAVIDAMQLKIHYTGGAASGMSNFFLMFN